MSEKTDVSHNDISGMDIKKHGVKKVCLVCLCECVWMCVDGVVESRRLGVCVCVCVYVLVGVGRCVWTERLAKD